MPANKPYDLVIIIGPGQKDFSNQFTELKTLCKKSNLNFCFIGNGIDSLSPESITAQLKDSMTATGTVIGLFHGSTIAPNARLPDEKIHMGELIGPWKNTATTPFIENLAASFPAAQTGMPPTGKIKIFSCKAQSSIPKTLRQEVALTTHAGIDTRCVIPMSIASIKRIIAQEAEAKKNGSAVDPFTAFANDFSHSPETVTLTAVMNGEQRQHTAYSSEQFIKEPEAIKEDIATRIIPGFLKSFAIDPSLHTRITAIPEHLSDEQLCNYRQDALHIVRSLQNATYIKAALDQMMDPEKLLHSDTLLRNDGLTLVHTTSSFGSIATMNMLLERFPDSHSIVNTKGFMPINVAAHKSERDAHILALMNAGTNPNEKNPNGWAPLHVATYKARTSNVTALLSNEHTDVNVTNRDGNTALHLTVKATHFRDDYDIYHRNYMPVFLKLMTHNAINPALLDKANKPALHYAALNAIKKVNKERDLCNHPQNDLRMLQTLLEHPKTPELHVKESLKEIINYPIDKRGPNYINALHITLAAFAKKAIDINAFVKEHATKQMHMIAPVARVFIQHGADPDIVLERNNSLLTDLNLHGRQSSLLLAQRLTYSAAAPRVMEASLLSLPTKETFGLSFFSPQEQQHFMQQNKIKLQILKDNGISVSELNSVNTVNFSWENNNSPSGVHHTMTLIKEHALKNMRNTSLPQNISTRAPSAVASGIRIG